MGLCLFGKYRARIAILRGSLSAREAICPHAESPSLTDVGGRMKLTRTEARRIGSAVTEATTGQCLSGAWMSPILPHDRNLAASQQDDSVLWLNVDKDGEVNGTWGAPWRVVVLLLRLWGKSDTWVDGACTLQSSAGSLDDDSGWWSSGLHVQAFRAAGVL